MVSKRAASAPESDHFDPDVFDINEEITVTASSGNVFEDLGLPDAEERLAKAKLAHRITTTIERRHLTQQQAAGVLGISQPKISDLCRGKLSGFSMERLFKLLRALDYDVSISVIPTPQRTKTRPSLRVVSEVAASGLAEERPRPVRS
jgi:predicted XRE-type DNA-binding protein